LCGSFLVNQYCPKVIMTLPSALTDHIGYWLRLVSNQVSQSFARKVEALGVTVAEWVVLRELYDGDNLAPSALADRLGLTRGAISKLTDRLEAKGLIARHAGENDKRYQILVLLSAGHDLVPQLSALADTNDAHFFAGLSNKDRAKLIRLLQSLAEQHGLKTTPME
jgi:DNA-binding MarR family transcriptional regulator